MRINGIENSNINLFTGNNAAKDIQSQKNQASKNNPDSLYAGDMNLNNEAITKKINARKRAMKLILNAYGNDKKVDDGLNEIREHQKRLSENLDTANSELNRLKESKEQLKEKYEIEEDSQEQKDLELLEKYHKEPFSLSKEEIERLKNMGSVTDYQREALELNALQNDWQKVADAASEGIINASKAISTIQIERLKTHEMTDAQTESKEILESSVKEITGMILSEAKDKVDEELEEKVDEAKEAKEKEKAEKAAQEKEESIGNTDSENEDTEKLMKDLKKIIDEEQVVEDDIKGLIMDAMI
ncbi:MAG: hypothetical protein IJA10_08645 [Lachnospiraceae bacterium]|nr:hypothetical protein [Lachnospiraceae bacterium]